MNADNEMTLADLRAIIRYCPDSGAFTRLVSKSNAHKPGVISGGRTDQGYIRLQVNGISYKAHRLAWFYMTGKWPKQEVDHINGIRDDNRWCNLREASRAFNGQNMHRARKDNKLGLLGVSKNKKRWMARIEIGGKRIQIGTFSSPLEAHQAYVDAKRTIHKGCTI